MKRSLGTSHWIALAFVLLLVGCSAPPENGNATSNNNATANANAPAALPQPATPLVTPAPTAASPAPAAQPAPTTAKPAETAARPAPKQSETPASGPKLVMVTQEKDLDFGKQPQEKTLVKAIRIKNGGKAALNIQSVTPS
ncbi:MAG TPA: hypothetical protein VJZ91_11060 [Blastocatellia bacterium]|nr:hypothetical protein [Blastocatellia bacterium]